MSRVNVGDKYGRLTVLSLIKDSKNPKAECKCDCGHFCFPQRGALKSGKATSCGCKRSEDFITRVTTHGKSKSAEYKIWRNMLSRCNNKNAPEYKNYGGRGIKVQWRSFEDFLNDMGVRPNKSWIDRTNNNGHYEKNNCKWVTPKENAKNKRTSKIWVIDNVEYQTSTEAAKNLNVHFSVIIRGCNGYLRNGKKYEPRKGWSFKFLYQEK